ncbi:MAG: S8 family serine peptidase [Planctomycetota bacterium]
MAHASDSLLVRCAAGADHQAFKDAIAALGGSVVWESAAVPGLCRVSIDAPVEQALIEFQSKPALVMCVEPDWIGRIELVPNDPFFSSQWSKLNTGQFIDGVRGTPGADINAAPAWDLFTGTSDTVVAIIDTGAVYSHPDLIDNIWTNTDEIPANGIDDDANGYIDDIHGYDFLNDSGSTIESLADNPVHATHIAGVIGASGDNGVGIAGINWDVRLMYLKVADVNGNIQVGRAVEAIEYAVANGATISNNSYSYNFPSPALQAVIASASANDHVFVASSGNDGTSEGGYPCAFELDNITCVTALTNRDLLPGFAQYNEVDVDLGAPGVDVLSTVPFEAAATGYGLLTGTSFASPQVTGAAALLRGYRPMWTATQIIEHLHATTRSVDDLAGRTVTGGALDLGAVMTGAFLPPTFDAVTTPEGLTPPCTPVTVSAIADPREDVIIFDPRVIYRLDAGPWQEEPLDEDGHATLPAVLCGQTLEYYFLTRGFESGDITYPVAGPDQPLVLEGGVLGEVYADSFMIDNGWTQGWPGDTAVSGFWSRGTPSMTSAQPGAGSDDDFCFVTDGSDNGLLGAFDVDGGTTSLVSPRIDLAGASDVVISYDRWFHNQFGTTPNEDVFTVEVSNDDGLTWVIAETVGPTGTGTAGGWIPSSVQLDSFIMPTTSVRIRFVAGDTGGFSIVEAGVDNIRISARTCGVQSLSADVTGDGVVNANDVQAYLASLSGTDSFDVAAFFLDLSLACSE